MPLLHMLYICDYIILICIHLLPRLLQLCKKAIHLYQSQMYGSDVNIEGVLISNKGRQN